MSRHNSFATRSIEVSRISTYAQSIIVGDVPAARAATKKCYFSRRSMSVDCGDFEKLVAKPKCKSKVWKHFGFPADAHGEVMDKKKIVCRLCKAIIAYLGNTSNLTYHLQRAHSQELVELREDSGDKPGPSVQPTAKQKQQSLPGIVGRSILFPQDSAKHKLLVDATADFICQRLLPLRVVDESSFRRLLEIAEPRFQLPHRTHFTDKVIPAKYRRDCSS